MKRRITRTGTSAAKLVAILLASFLMISMLASCINQGGDSPGNASQTPAPTDAAKNDDGSNGDRQMDGNLYLTGLPIVKEKETLTVAVGRHLNDATENYDEKHFVQKAEEETNMYW